MMLLALSFTFLSYAYEIPPQELTELGNLLKANGGDMFLENDESFTAYSSPYNSACAQNPKAVFLPKTEADLSEVVMSARSHNVEIVATTVRLNQNCLSTTDGYLINMRLFNKMEMEKNNTQIRLGGGTIGDETNVYVQSQGEYFVSSLACTWGSNVGPLFGGGVLWLSIAQFPGHMADQLIEARVMDAEGVVRVTSEYQNQDLFWALRGGGGQLGIVTEIVTKVHEKPGRISTAGFIVPCANNCDLENRLAMMDAIGMWENTLADTTGTLIVFSSVIELFISCLDCDLAMLVGDAFPDAFPMPGYEEFTHEDATATEMYNAARKMAVPFWGVWDGHKGFTFEDVNANMPVMPLSSGGYFFEEHSSEIVDVYREALSDNPEKYPTTLTWTSHLGRGLSNNIDSAASFHKGSRIYWAAGSVEGYEGVFPFLNNGFAKLPNFKSQYWNYKNKYTSEEHSFGSNLERIREVRNKYDPSGYFALPADKNEGSDFIESCFARYDCNGNGELATESASEIPAGGCKCECHRGWEGKTCNVENKCTAVVKRKACKGLKKSGCSWKKGTCLKFTQCRKIRTAELCEKVESCEAKVNKRGKFRMCINKVMPSS